LLTLVAGLAFVGAAEAASINTLSVPADPAWGVPATIAVTGTAEGGDENVGLYQRAMAHDASPCASNQGAEARKIASESIGFESAFGAFSKTFAFTPEFPGTVRICAYVYDRFNGAGIAIRSSDIAVRLPQAAVRIEGLPGEYLSGVPALARIFATTEANTDAELYLWSGRGDAPCDVAEKYFPTAEGLSKLFSVVFGPEPAHTFCAWVIKGGEDGPVLASARFVARKRPLAVPVVGEPVIGTGRTPSFTWAGAEGARDTLVLVEDGDVILRVTERGAVAPRREGGAPINDPDELFGRRRSAGQSSAGPSRSIAVLTRDPDGTLSGQLNVPLPPGRYRWYVERRRDPGELVRSEEGGLRLHGPALTGLRVSSRRVPGGQSTRPGHTTLTITTTPYARVRLTLQRGSRRQVIPLTWGHSRIGRQRIEWSCDGGGASVYRYEVAARDEAGRTLTRTGRFRTISPAQCAALRATERAARARAAAARAARARAAAAARRAYYARWFHNCRAAGGTPVTVYLKVGPRVMCRAPYGGFLSVPT
jgi:hypothetical protein